MENIENNKDSERNEVSNFLWEEFKIRVETYKNYLNIALQANVFFYVTAGAVLGFYLNKPSDNNPLEYFLLLPILIGAVLAGIFIYAAALQKEASIIIEKIRNESDEKGLRIAELPDINLLYLLLLIFGGIFFLVAVSLIVVPHIAVSKDLTYFTGAGVIVLTGGPLTYFFIKKMDKKLRNFLDRKLREAKKLNTSDFSDEDLTSEKAGILHLPENQKLPESFWEEERPSLKSETAIKAVIDERNED
jgi:hypothetical protein